MAGPSVTSCRSAHSQGNTFGREKTSISHWHKVNWSEETREWELWWQSSRRCHPLRRLHALRCAGSCYSYENITRHSWKTVSRHTSHRESHTAIILATTCELFTCLYAINQGDNSQNSTAGKQKWDRLVSAVFFLTWLETVMTRQEKKV